MSNLNIKNETGFTLIELLAVVVIIGILATTASPAYVKIMNNMKNSNIKSQVNTALNYGSAYAKTKLQKIKVKFETNDIKIISLNADDTENTEIEVIKFDEKMQTQVQKEVIYNKKGFPTANNNIKINAIGAVIDINVYTDGRIQIN